MPAAVNRGNDGVREYLRSRPREMHVIRRSELHGIARGVGGGLLVLSPAGDQRGAMEGTTRPGAVALRFRRYGSLDASPR